ncbi:MAG: PaaI family thioesterase [Chloroflexi bacterium]|nr:PaaI family thioesterase [Chloroflexota bacterium]
MLPWEKPLAHIDTDLRHYDYCFGCGRSNPLGLKLAFKWDGETATTTFVVQESHQGWPGTMHGGLTCAILDEAIGWAVYFRGILGVTGKLVTRLKRPVSVGQTVHISATITGMSRKLVEAASKISLPDGTVLAEATGVVYIMPQNKEKKA